MQKYEKHIREHSLSVEILCFTTLNNSLGPRNFLRKLGEVAPLNFQREKLRTSLLQRAICTCLNAVFFHVKSHEQWLLVSISQFLKSCQCDHSMAENMTRFSDVEISEIFVYVWSKQCGRIASLPNGVVMRHGFTVRLRAQIKCKASLFHKAPVVTGSHLDS